MQLVVFRRLPALPSSPQAGSRPQPGSPPAPGGAGCALAIRWFARNALPSAGLTLKNVIGTTKDKKGHENKSDSATGRLHPSGECFGPPETNQLSIDFGCLVYFVVSSTAAFGLKPIRPFGFSAWARQMAPGAGALPFQFRFAVWFEPEFRCQDRTGQWSATFRSHQSGQNGGRLNAPRRMGVEAA
jgi:hypothetical protein